MSDNILYESDAKTQPRDTRAPAREARPRQAVPPTNGPRLHRRRRKVDPFYVDPRIIPEGFSYEWKTESIYGQPQTQHMIDMRENHWRPVPAARHPELAAEGETVIWRAGTVLCERPKYLTEEAQDEDIRDAMRPVQGMEEVMYGTPPNYPNSMTRDHPSVRNASYVRRQYAPGEPVNEGQDGRYSEP